MKNDHLATYLNDHLAGSIGALEMLDRLVKDYEAKSIAHFFAEARAEIAADQEQLRAIMKALDVPESGVRKAGAWLAEKLSRAKIRVDGEEAGDPGLVLALEALVLGVKGKELLWEVLVATLRSWPQLQPFDFALLRRRAVEQGARLDEKRVEVASRAFRSDPGS